MQVIESSLLKEISGGGYQDLDTGMANLGLPNLSDITGVYQEAGGAYVFTTDSGDYGSINFRENDHGGAWEFNINGDTFIAWMTIEGDQAQLDVMADNGEIGSTTFKVYK